MLCKVWQKQNQVQKLLARRSNTMEDKKIMHVIQAMNMRDLVMQINDLGIQKEDIAWVFSKDDGLFLMYYK